jgi:hypothetical protein
MKVAELREELENLECATSGNKAGLVKRLTEALIIRAAAATEAISTATISYDEFFERVYDLCAESIGLYENWMGQNQFHYGYCEVEKKEYCELLCRMKSTLQESRAMRTQCATTLHFKQTEDPRTLARGDAAIDLARTLW